MALVQVTGQAAVNPDHVTAVVLIANDDGDLFRTVIRLVDGSRVKSRWHKSSSDAWGDCKEILGALGAASAGPDDSVF